MEQSSVSKIKPPVIVVYGREGCGICKRIKKRITDMGFEFAQKNADDYINYREDWREMKCEMVMAGYMLNDEHLPIISIDGEFMVISKALNRLKEIKDGNTE